MVSRASCSVDGPSDIAGTMNAYFEGLRNKRDEALRRETGKGEAARLSGVSLSSVKRYARMAQELVRLSPKMDEGARRLLESDLEERQAATLSQRRQYFDESVGSTEK